MIACVKNCILKLISLLILINCGELANILAVFPTPSLSHQKVFLPLIHELAKKGHLVTVITTHPVFPKQGSPVNLTEIDVHDISVNIWRNYVVTADGNEENLPARTKKMFSLIFELFEAQFWSPDVQNLIKDKNKKFDLLILEHFIRPALSYSHLYNVPVITFNAFGHMIDTVESVDIASNPIIYPIVPLQKFHNLNVFEKVYQMYLHFATKHIIDSSEKDENKQLKRIYGPEIPELKELKKNIHMTFLNIHHFWDSNRPVPPNIVYVGGIHKKPVSTLPKDLQQYLDQSTNGVIYVSFGTAVFTSLFPSEKIKLLTDVFSELPYNVLLKWDDDLPGCPSNVKTGKWFPQADLLRHQNVKLFITHGGYASMTESVDAGVPLIGIPMAADQWYNMELCIKHEIGVKLDFKTLIKEKLKSDIESVIRNESYRQNILRIRSIINDQPQSPLERAVWWTEHVLRHGGAAHLRSAAAHMHWTEYYEINLVLMLLSTVFTLVLSIGFFTKLLVMKILFCCKKVKRE